jgi:hypothetical protein
LTIAIKIHGLTNNKYLTKFNYKTFGLIIEFAKWFVSFVNHFASFLVYGQRMFPVDAISKSQQTLCQKQHKTAQRVQSVDNQNYNFVSFVLST